MRNAFVAKLTELAKVNENIVLLVGDIGFGVFEHFKKNSQRDTLTLVLLSKTQLE